MKASETILAHANRSLAVRDELGRALTIRRITAVDRLRLFKAAGPELAQNEGWLNLAAIAVAVAEIDGVPRATPANERQIEAAVAELGDPGMQAAAEGLRQIEDDSLFFEAPPQEKHSGTPI